MNGYTLASPYNGCIGEYPINEILNIDSNINTNVYSGNDICFSNLNYYNTKIDNQGVLRIFILKLSHYLLLLLVYKCPRCYCIFITRRYTMECSIYR